MSITKPEFGYPRAHASAGPAEVFFLNSAEFDMYGEGPLVLYSDSGQLQVDEMQALIKLSSKYEKEDLEQFYVGFESYQAEWPVKDAEGKIIGSETVSLQRPGPGGVECYIFIRRGIEPKSQKLHSSLGQTALGPQLISQ